MRLSAIVFAVLPALALAQETESTSTTTMIATTTLTKTYTLSEVHTVIHTPGHNATATLKPSSSLTTATNTAQAKPTTVDKDNAGAALDAGRIFLAGMAGLAAVVLI